MTDMYVEYDLSRSYGVGVIQLKLRSVFLFVVVMDATNPDDAWYGEAGYATAKHCRALAAQLKFWIRFGAEKADGKRIPFRKELPVYRYGDAYRACEQADVELATNTDSDSVTVFVETVSDATCLRNSLLDLVDRMTNAHSPR